MYYMYFPRLGLAVIPALTRDWGIGVIRVIHSARDGVSPMSGRPADSTIF
jgi:hypothetical protein